MANKNKSLAIFILAQSTATIPIWLKIEFQLQIHLFLPVELKNIICFKSQNQSKRGFGWEGSIFGEIPNEKVDGK